MVDVDSVRTDQGQDDSYFDYRTRGGLSGAGKPLCYVTLPDPQGDTPKERFAHHLMYRGMVNDIIDVLLAEVDCVVVSQHLDGSEAPWDKTQQVIESAQLVVPLVNRAFVENPDSRARREALYALKRGTSLLPIMLQGGLDAAFERILGKIQYIPYFKAGTEHGRSFAEHLWDRAQALMGSLLDFEGTWDAFPVHAFVSYRKKNREHVRTLMSQIDGVRSLRGMAVWYDEFLVSGERYDDDIDRRLRESDLVLLVVTPDLLEEGNYVLTTEYRVALEEGKLILPILMAPTDMQELRDAYPSLPKILEDVSSDAIEAAVLELLGSPTPEPASADQAYRQGMAYLGGMLVERNPGVAVELLQAASDGGSLAATDELVQVHMSSYLGLQDMRQAIRLMERGVEQACAQDDVSATDLRNRLQTLVNLFTHEGQYDQAITVATEAVRLLEQSEHDCADKNEWVASLAAAKSHLGELYELVDDSEDARSLYEESYLMLYRAVEKLSREALLERGFLTATDKWAYATNDMLQSLVYCLGPLVELNRAAGDEVVAIAQSADLFAALAVLEERCGTSQFAEAALRARYSEARYLHEKVRLDEAKKSYQEVIELAKRLVSGHVVTFSVFEQLAAAHRGLAQIAVDEGDYRRALECLEAEISYREQCCKRWSSYDATMDLAQVHVKALTWGYFLGMVEGDLASYEPAALRHLEEATRLGSDDHGALVDAKVIRWLRDAYYELGDDARWKMHQIELARRFLERSCSYVDQLARIRGAVTFDDCTMAEKIEDETEACYRKLGWDNPEYVRRGDEAAVQRLRWLCRAALLEPSVESVDAVREYFFIKTESARVREDADYNLRLCVALFEEMFDVIQEVVSSLVRHVPLDRMFGVGIVASMGYACETVGRAAINGWIELSGVTVNDLDWWCRVLGSYGMR